MKPAIMALESESKSRRTLNTLTEPLLGGP
jgi:hypothetical protein